MLIIYQGLNCVKIFKMYKAEQMAELQAEKDALEAQRKQSEEMMSQLLAMQQQMAQQAQSAPAAVPAQTAPVQAQPSEQPDVAAMLAELQALRAQVASQSGDKKEEATPQQSDLENTTQKAAHNEVNEA